MVVNLGAYSCEIIRAGIQATPRGQFEAGASLAMTPFETFRHVVLMPALQRIWPALSSQIVIVMLGSAVVSQIAARGPDLRRQLHPVAQLPRLRGLHRLDADLSRARDRAAAGAARRRRGDLPAKEGLRDDRVHALGHPAQPAARDALDHRAVARLLRRRRHRRGARPVRAHRQAPWLARPARRATSSCSRARRC